MIALITGVTSGIGKSSAEIFAKNGYDLIITGRRKDRLESLAKELQKKFKIKILTLNFDVRSSKEVEKNISTLKTSGKKLMC